MYCGYFWAPSTMWGATDNNRPEPTSSLYWPCVHGANWIQLELSGCACYTPTSWVFWKLIWVEDLHVPSSTSESHSHTFHEAQKHPLNSDVLILCSTVLELSGRSPVTLASLGMLRSIVKDWRKYHIIFLPPCGRIFDPMDSLSSSVHGI